MKLKEWIYLIYLADDLKKRNIYIIIFTVSLLGLAVVQYQYLQIGLSLAKVQFNRKVQDAAKEVKDGLATQNQLTFLVGKAIQKDGSYFKLGLDSIQDASSYFLNDFITENLVKHGLEANFTYNLFSKDSIYYLQSPSVSRKKDNVVSYPIELYGYLPNLLEKRLVLELHFQNLNNYFLGQLNGLTFPSLLFLVGIVVAIIWALRTYYWQRNVITTTNEFINNLTHELKTPVFSISLATKLLEEDAGPKQQHVISLIKQQTERLSGHIDKVLELGSLEHKKNAVVPQELDFRPHLLKLCKEFETLSSIEGTTFDYVLDEGCYRINVERFHLENAINNLLDNAKKYAENPKITLNARLGENKLEIVIEDNGMGIKKEEQERIFKKYYRVGNGDQYNVKGYGLGLSYVKRIMHSFRGKIILDSEPGRGTRIALVLPLVKNGNDV
ncbi:sensor histidine kinase [Flagellimonas meishanensis]|uniref:sensor histidine kinase n=1 Tax=Flagellimonas meishanensis TaxID=2873264 RepID=UPI001CA7917F|nr:HAMP domain-containing sensor histidine kinase [[Muricauda] meishanensis]